MSDREVSQDKSTPEPKEPDEWDARRKELKERYAFYILNPAHTKGYEYSLWVREDDGAYPVVNSNTGGFVTFNSRDDDVGDALELTDEFFILLGTAFHEGMCFMPDLYFRDDHFNRTFESIYDGKPRKHEVWIAQVLLDWMFRPGEVIPELRPLCEWASDFSKFGMPRLGEEHEVKSGE